MDKRAIKTKMACYRALIALLEDKPFEDIKIQDITDKAGINRVTFYGHFHDKADFYKQCCIAFIDLMSCGMPHSTTEQNIMQAFRGLQKHSNAYCLLDSGSGASIFESEIIHAVLSWYSQKGLPFKEEGTSYDDFRLQAIAYSVPGILRWYSKNCDSYTPETACEYYVRFFKINE